MNELFDWDYPIWKCPDCKKNNRYVNTFMEICGHCKKDHTLDWENFIIDDEVREHWGMKNE